ncbi:hypothetical protein [Acidovorax sp.]|uniref:hypothetical protein n=1 Tax=Acidovorax sp. TaxID=1872122 RepID=UPI0025BF1D50|nr:hypothetical protein [Acidovorax sp.]MBW8463606.1 hypothetical protein [Acidovorax sp.]
MTPEQVQALAHQASTYACQALLSNEHWQEVRDQKFAELVIRDALEEAAEAVEKATYRKRWLKAGINSAPMQPCESAAVVRKLKEDIQ